MSSIFQEWVETGPFRDSFYFVVSKKVKYMFTLCLLRTVPRHEDENPNAALFKINHIGTGRGQGRQQ